MFVAFSTADFHTMSVGHIAYLPTRLNEGNEMGMRSARLTHFLDGERGSKVDTSLQSKTPRLIVELGHFDGNQLSHFRYDLIRSSRLPIKHGLFHRRIDWRKHTVWAQGTSITLLRPSGSRATRLLKAPNGKAPARHLPTRKLLHQTLSRSNIPTHFLPYMYQWTWFIRHSLLFSLLLFR